MLTRSVEESLDRVAVRSGDEVAILVDTDSEETVWKAFLAGARARGAQPTVVLMMTRAANGLEPTSAAADAIARANVVFALTTASATHTKALKQAASKGARVCSMPGVTLDIMTNQVMTPDYAEMQRLGNRLAEIFAPAQWMHVRTAAGTDLRVAMGGWQRMPMVDDGTFAPGVIANLPAGEALIVPWEGASEGQVVVDLAVSCDPKPLAAPITITFRAGRVTDVSGDSAAAQTVRDLLAMNGDTAGNFAEMAIGINRYARNTGVLIETEKQFGSAHIGIGNSANLGGHVWAPIHIDVIFARPSIAVDGKMVLSYGQFDPHLFERESYLDASPFEGSVTLMTDGVLVRDGKLCRRWRDTQRIERVSQIGNDQTAARSVDVLKALSSGQRLSSEHRRVVAVMARYGLIGSDIRPV